MKSVFRNIFLALAFAGSAWVQAQTPVQAPAVVASQAEHPFYRSAELPKWSQLTPQQALIDAHEAVRRARARLAEIATISPESATFDNTFMAVEESTEELQCVVMLLQHLTAATDSPEARAAMDEVAKLMADCTAEIVGNEQLWHLMQAASTPEKLAQLSPAKQRAVKQLMDIFRDNGAELSPEKKALKHELDKEMLLLSMQYDKNLQDFTQSWQLHITDPTELQGVPVPVMAALQQSAAEEGLDGYLITMRDETVLPVLALCCVEGTRIKCWHAWHGYGAGTEYDNAPVIAQLMEKRQAFAELLGFKNYADYAARTRMVQHGEEALAFVDDLMKKIKPAYDEEVKGILQAYNEFYGTELTALSPWDEPHALSIYSSQEQATNTIRMSPYLKCTDALNGMFGVYSQLLGVTFKQLPTCCVQPGQTCPEGKVEVWHPTVKCIAVYDTQSKVHLGTFYLDLYRRDNKRAGAWCAPIRLANPGPGGAIQEPHVAALMTNFDPPVKGRPNLLQHFDLTILFHEFGHMMHHLLSHTELKGHCAMGVAWDFTEFPSTLSENWAWSPEVLATFARHYKSGKPCPPALLQKLVESRSSLRANTYMETMQKAKLDLEIHMFYNEKFKGRSLDEVSHAILGDYQLPFSYTPYSPLRNLPHCFVGGYAAGVYSYLWSEVMAADAYTRFAEEGLMNPSVGKHYRETILEKGDSIPADELYRMFMGRNPDIDAFLKLHNLTR